MSDTQTVVIPLSPSTALSQNQQSYFQCSTRSLHSLVWWFQQIRVLNEVVRYTWLRLLKWILQALLSLQSWLRTIIRALSGQKHSSEANLSKSESWNLPLYNPTRVRSQWFEFFAAFYHWSCCWLCQTLRYQQKEMLADSDRLNQAICPSYWCSCTAEKSCDWHRLRIERRFAKRHLSL